MLEKELDVVRKSEREAREVVERAKQEASEILRTAQKEAKDKHLAATQDAHEKGESLYNDAMNRIAKHRESQAVVLNEQVRATQMKSATRVDVAVESIVEGMWKRGDRHHEQV